MNTTEIYETYAEAINALEKRKLKDAIEAIHYGMISKGLIESLMDESIRIDSTYEQMLHYYTEGLKDPMQAQIYNELLASTYNLADKARRKLLTDVSDEYYSQQRTLEKDKRLLETYTEAIDMSHDLTVEGLYEYSMTQLFKRIWASPYLSEDETEHLQNIITNEEYKPDSQSYHKYMTVMNCQIVSALTLGLQTTFDKNKILLLIDAAEHGEEEVSIRAYIGLLLTLYAYKNRTSCYPEIVHRLDSLAEAPAFRKNITIIIQRFIISRETENIANRLNHEIIPEIMKLNPNFRPNLPYEDISIDDCDSEMNPEWMSGLADSSLGKKMEEINKLQDEGADVLHSTFANLKNYPFFNDISNWFMPFYMKEASSDEERSAQKPLEFLSKASLMCNSDMHSLDLSMQQLPEDKRYMILGPLVEQMEEYQQQMGGALQAKINKTERIAGRYIQDLYRFYKLYRRRNEFADIFAQGLDFHNIPMLQAYFSDKEDLLNIAEHYLRRNYFEDALDIYERLSKISEGDEMLYQKKGYCYQMTGNYESAISEYAKAELINPDSKWLMRRTAQCYRAIKKPEMAISYYINYEKTDSENLSILLSIGSCYLEMKNYTEALKYYFKVDYLDNGSRAWRPIAWCSFLIGKYEQARNYYSKILSAEPESQDYMNAGHTEWVMYNIKGALNFYMKAALKLELDFEKFCEELDRDIPELIAAGVDPVEIPLVMDKLHYTIINNPM